MAFYRPSIPEGTILDIGDSRRSTTFRELITAGLSPADPEDPPLLDSSLMWDDAGLAMWRQMIDLPWYNQTWDELELMEKHIDGIAHHFEDEAVVVDLGSGDIRKSAILLSKLDAQNKSITFYAADVSKASLEANMAKLAQKAFKNVRCYGLSGSLDDAYEWLCTKTLEAADNDSVDSCPRYFCSFGSQFGNGYPSLEVARFQKWSKLLREQDRLLVGMDGTSDQTRLWDSYHDSEGLFERYIRNGFAHSNRELGGEWFKDEEWVMDGEILQQPTMHRFVLTSLQDVRFDYEVDLKEGQPKQASLDFPKGSKIHCYEAFKYGSVEMGHFFKYVKYDIVDTWKAPDAEYYQYLIKHADTKTDIEEL